MQTGHNVGLVEYSTYCKVLRKIEAVQKEIARLNEARPTFTESVRSRIRGTYLEDLSPAHTLAQLLKRQESRYSELLKLLEIEALQDIELIEEVETQIKYEGYIRRQLAQVSRFRKLEQKSISPVFNYDAVPGFSREVLEKFKRFRPATIGQASRISGVTPAAISLLMVALEKQKFHGESLPPS
jgi:tRNA uridine 5-carboxymethylaminomethyl modification enzyme